MKTLKHILLLGAWSVLALPAPGAVPPPTPHAPVPTERQVRWQEKEIYAFVHFSINTFTDKEWGYGDESPEKFNPTAFDANQIARAAKEGGLSGLILTAKHHDGFCLWPSAYTEHNISKSPFRGGKGDVVKEMADACRNQGIAFGLYLSPWDRNRADYAQPGYLTYYRNQIRELLTNYGPIFEMWFDGANGGDGWYGGKKERRNISGDYYDWSGVTALIRQLQPGCVVWGADRTVNGKRGYADARWGGSEKGVVHDPCWPTMSTDALGLDAECFTGRRNGDVWCPPEADASIRPGWFYHAREDGQVKSPEKLMEIYFQSVGRGANLILNLPPDRRGILHENDVAALRGFKKLMDATFLTNLAARARATASNVRGGDVANYGPQRLLDNQRHTYWASDDMALTPSVVLEFDRPVTFNVIRLREEIRLGVRVDDWALDAWTRNEDGGAKDAGEWTEFASGSAIGACRLVHTGEPITSTRIRLRITKGAACPALSELSVFRMPDGGINPATVLNAATVGVSKKNWKVVSVSFDASGSGGKNAIDGDVKTIWHTSATDGQKAPPQEIVVDMGRTIRVGAFTYLPRQDGYAHGTVDRYEFYVSSDGQHWGEPAAVGEFANVKANPILQTVPLRQPTSARYFRFVGTHVVERSHIVVAELGIVEDKAKTP